MSSRKSTFFYVCTGLGITILILNIAARFKGFCNMYRNTVYGFISDALGHMTSNLPIILGEVLMYVFIIIMMVFLILVILRVLLRRKSRIRNIYGGYSKFVLLTCLLTLFVYTLNWIIPFGGSVLEVKGASDRKYTLDEVIAVRNIIVEKANECALEVPRDDKGKVIYDNKKVKSELVYTMKKMGDDYPLLKGYYPDMKPAMISDVLDWMNIGGYTYPYTMEVTYNKYCTNLYYPFLFAHESSHHQGYYKESEANFIAFAACINSDNKVARYSGYLEIYDYIEEAVLNKIPNDEIDSFLKSQPSLSKQVCDDITDAVKQSEELYNQDSHPAQKLSKSAEDASEVGWEVQGDVLKEDGYDGVVEMVLKYYDVENSGK